MPRSKDGSKRRRKQQRKRILKMATWNIQGIRNKEQEVLKEMEKMKIDICVLTETKKKGVGSEKAGSYMKIYSGVPKSCRAKRGVAILVHNRLVKYIKSWQEVDEQILTLEISKNGHNIVVIGVYAPSEDSSIETKEKFYEKLLKETENINASKEICILGDLNARVGKKDNNAVIGQYGESVVNDNGTRLIDLCESMSLKVMNGFYCHKNIHKFSWTQPRRGLRSIIDYLIMRQQSKLKTLDVRVYRGAECGTDHHLIIAKVLIKYRASNKIRPGLNSPEKIDKKRYNLESLKHETSQFLYKLRLATKLHNVTIENKTAEELYEQIKGCIHEAAREAIGYIEIDEKQNPEWWSHEMTELVDTKKKAYQIWLQTQDLEDWKAYTYWNREVKKTVARRKNETWERKCDEMDRQMGGTQVSEAWKFIKNLRKEKKETGNINPISMTEWNEYYRNLLTEVRPEYEMNYGEIKIDPPDEIRPITVDEVKETVRELKNGKAAGPGDIPNELIKNGPTILFELLTELCNKCMIEQEDIPNEWNLANISSIHKKGDKRQCKNYRGISIISSVGRLYGRLIKKRIESQFNEVEDQSGFRAGRSCVDNIFVLQQVIEKRTARNLPTHLVFIDLEKAYDTVPLKKLFKTLTTAGLSKTYISAIVNMYKDAKSSIKIGSATSDPFPVTKGLRQGCSLSPTLFKIYIQEALKNWRKKCAGMGIQLGNHCLTNLFFADDQVVVANENEDIDYMIRKLTEEYEKWGLTINLTKTEYLKIKEDQNDHQLSVKEIRNCEEYKYLGTIIAKEGTSKRDIKQKLQQSRKVIQTLNPLLWSPKIKLKTKMKIYTTVVEPILTYGSECWQITEKERQQIGIAEMDYLRRACRISKLEHIPNEEIRRKTGRIYNTVDTIETKQLSWYGHVMRMGEERWPKRVMNYRPPERRRRGRPALEWKEGIKNVMRDRAIDEEDWRDRKRWKSKCGMRQRL